MENNTPQEPQVVEKVLNEIKSLGDSYTGIKKNYDELRTNHEELKKIVDRQSEDGLDKEQFAKLAEDISTRQAALDDKQSKEVKEAHERMDQIEVSMKRLPQEGSKGEDLITEAKQFMIEAGAVSSKDEKGVTFDFLDGKDIDITNYKLYKKGFEAFLRKYGGNQNLAMDPDMYKALSVGIDPDGGYTVTPAMSARIIEKVFESDPTRQLATVESITTGALEFMVDWGQAGYGWETETVAGSETTTPDFRKKRIPVHIMYAKPRATQTLLEDSGINVENWLADKVSDRFMRAESAAFVTGDGIGKPRGFLTYDDGTSYGQIEQVDMGAAAALTADGFYDIKFSLLEYYLNRGTWLMQRSTVAAALKLKDGEGNYLWRPGLSDREPGTILGLPVRMSPTMPAVAANALAVAVADWKEAYTIVDRLGITVQRDPYTVKPFVEFYTRKRVGGDVVNYEAIKIGKIAV